MRRCAAAALQLARRQTAGGLFRAQPEHFLLRRGLGAELAPGGPQPDVLNFAWRDYGNRPAPGTCTMLRRAEPADGGAGQQRHVRLRAGAVAAHRARGDEIVGHGRTNAERQGTLDEAASAF
jgi:hypothetical protein